MNLTWDLEILYKGYDDPKYINDLEKAKELIKEINELALNLDENKKVECIEKSLKNDEELNRVLSDLFSYSSLRTSTNVNDFEALGKLGELSMMLQETVVANVTFQKFIKDFDLDSLAKESELIKTYLFILKKSQQDAKHMLSDKEEVLASKLNLVGSSSWSDLQSALTSNLMIKVDGFDQKMPLSSVRNLAYENDPVVRKNGYLAEVAAYKNIDTSVAMALNNIKREVNIMCELRGYKDALEKTLIQSNMTKATLDAMIEAIKEEAPSFRKYFKLKAQALGHKNGLPFYDLFAPMGSLTKTYTIEEAKDEVLAVYRSFSEPLYEMGKRAFEERWIDVEPKEGKAGGAFCAGLDNYGQSRILTNFTGSLSDIQTLAHELGHAYHGQVCLNNSVLNRDYPMPLAETASILCETLMAKKH